MFVLYITFLASFSSAEESITLGGTVSFPVCEPTKKIYLEEGTRLKAPIYSGVSINLVSNKSEFEYITIYVYPSPNISAPFLKSPFLNGYYDIQVILAYRLSEVALYDAVGSGFMMEKSNLTNALNDPHCNLSYTGTAYSGDGDVWYMPWLIYCNDRCYNTLFLSTILPALTGALAWLVVLGSILALNYYKWANLGYQTRVFRTFFPLFLCSSAISVAVIILENYEWNLVLSPNWYACPKELGGNIFERAILNLLVIPIIFALIPAIIAIVWASYALIIHKVPSQRGKESSCIYSMGARKRASTYFGLWILFMLCIVGAFLAPGLNFYEADCSGEGCMIFEVILVIGVGVCTSAFVVVFIILAAYGSCCKRFKESNSCEGCTCCYADGLIKVFQHCDDADWDSSALIPGF